MQVTGISTESVNAGANVVAMRAREINSTLKASTQKITESIQATNRAAQVLQEAQSVDDVYAQTLQTVDQIKRVTEAFASKVEFSVNKDINRVVVKIIDATTNNTIKVIPSEEIQKIQARIQEALGLLFDEKA